MDQKQVEPLEGHSKYEKVSDLGKGSYGVVQLARNKQTGEMVAIKFMPRGDKIAQVYVEREITNHWMLSHPHIIQFHEVFLTPQHLAIAMEFAPGGDMFQHVRNRGGLSEREARWFFQQLIVALDYCHRMGVANRDIKLENTLLDGNRRPLLKLCDFGYSKHRDMHSAPHSRVGTPGYTAPEVISNRDRYDGNKVDVWSAGVMLYVMLFCRYPFERVGDEDEMPTTKFQNVMDRVLRGDYSFPLSVPVSDSCKDLLKRILITDPALRITIEGIQQHPWYLKDLPPGLNHFNDTCLASREAEMAAMERKTTHVRAVVEEARRLGPVAGSSSSAPASSVQLGGHGQTDGVPTSGDSFESTYEVDDDLHDMVDEEGNLKYLGSFEVIRR